MTEALKTLVDRKSIMFSPRIRVKDNTIAGFFGEYRFLSNFHESPFLMDGILYPTVEHAYQAQKALSDSSLFKEIAEAESASVAKKLGRKAKLPDNWDSKKVLIMRRCITLKFLSNLDLKTELLKTVPYNLEETNWWGDEFWGVCNGAGDNILGLLLMDLRDNKFIDNLL